MKDVTPADLMSREEALIHLRRLRDSVNRYFEADTRATMTGDPTDRERKVAAEEILFKDARAVEHLVEDRSKHVPRSRKSPTCRNFRETQALNAGGQLGVKHTKVRPRRCNARARGNRDGGLGCRRRVAPGSRGGRRSRAGEGSTTGGRRRAATVRVRLLRQPGQAALEGRRRRAARRRGRAGGHAGEAPPRRARGPDEGNGGRVRGLLARVRRRSLRPRTLEKYEGAIRVHITPLLGRVRLSELTEEHIVELVSEMQRAGYAPWTIRGVLTPLGRILGHAARRGVIASNPMLRLERGERPAVGRREQRVLTREEIGQLLAAARGVFRPLLATAVFTGLRLGELLGLVWANVDFDAGFIRVRRQLDRDGSRVEPKTPRPGATSS